MRHLADFCLQVKMMAIELVSLIGFLGILGVGLYWEWQHLVAFVHR